MVIRANLGDLEDIDLTAKVLTDNDVLAYDGTNAKWVPQTKVSPVIGSESNSYIIELDRWGIKNDGTSSYTTTKGINDALLWAKSKGYNHIILSSGTYKLKIDPITFSCIVLQSDMHFEMVSGCILELEANSSPWYSVFGLKGVKNSKISGGKIIGDKETHKYELMVKFVRGGINADGSLNDNPNFIRSEVVDRYENPGLLQNFRLWSIPGVTSKGYSFYQYKDSISNSTLVGSRNNGGFAPAQPTGRGWFASVKDANKMIFVIDITASPLSDAQIIQINAKVDNQNWTHEWGQGIQISGSHNIVIESVEISNCTGDAIVTAWLEYKINSSDYVQEDMGAHIYIQNCNLHHCRRQGISLTGSNDIYILNNNIHHIGKNIYGVIDGTAPMFGIDIESMWSETNIPTWRPELNKKGLELNNRIYIYDNYIYSNARGHFVNADGINVVVENNTFEGSNVGGVSSYQNNWYVKYLDNTFIECEFVVKGDNFVNGVISNNASVKLMDIQGAVLQNCKIVNGLFYGSSSAGYFGTPTVDVVNNVFTFSKAHGMGNGAKICFEQWSGKVPTGISVDKLYYTINVTATSFQVSEVLNGNPVAITEPGKSGFNISRYDYGRCYISNVLIEKEWSDSAIAGGVDIILTGGVIKDLVVKNYGLAIRVPENYVGRPNIVEGITVIEGSVRLECCNMTNGKFMKAKSSRIGGDIALGVNDVKYSRTVSVDNCMFQNVSLNFDGNVLNTRSTFLNSIIRKVDNENISVIAQSYMENTSLSLHWLTKEKTMKIVRNIFNNVTFDITKSTLLIDNVDINTNSST
ncbi:right-handed parallel beta-helix repeat-containing protein [Bacillus toyonensis]|uniref:Pectin lyase n=1 Tax=Bacillus toyonensis TaxID=155322 RepID=A0A2B5X6M8_9BACI|nr:right-handed parallel beta-helix repeat-containing protein [Bacillus toyonensis]PGA92064.1 pectin lyase [Bacillus toyonensis]PHD65130.1 pectin lyase [Bacillus toyonensis]